MGKASDYFDGVTILEVGNGIAVGYCGRVLRSLGATVLKVEATGDLDWVRGYGSTCPNHHGKSCSWCHLNGSKVRLLVSKLTGDAPASQWRALIDRVDFAIAGEGRLSDRFCTWLEGAGDIGTSLVRIVGAVDGPSGLNIYPDESAAVAAGLRDLYGEARPPSGLRFDLAEINAGAHAAATVALALAARALGRTKPVQMDVGIYESSFSIIEIAAQTLLLSALFDEGFPDIIASPLGAPYLCRDGRSLVINLYGKDVWTRMCGAMARPDLQFDARFLDTVSMWSHSRELRAILDRWCTDLDRDDAVMRMQKQRIPCAPIYDLSELTSDEHVAARKILSVDGHHSHDSIGAAHIADGERNSLAYVGVREATNLLKSIGLEEFFAEISEEADAVLINI